MTLKYTSTRPDETLDALQDLEDAWTHPESEPETVLVVARVARYGISKTKKGSDWQATAGLVQVEILHGEAAKIGEKLLAEEYADRTGNAQLPIGEVAMDLDDTVDQGGNGPEGSYDGTEGEHYDGPDAA